MQASIYKYPLKLTDHQLLELPAHSRIMTVQVQPQPVFDPVTRGLMRYEEILCAWAWVLLSDAAKADSPDTWEVFIIGTGQSADIILEPTPPSYVGTVQMEHGQLVWHVFVRPLRKSPE